MTNNTPDTREQEKKSVALAAVQLVKNSDVVGLGTGSTAYYAIAELGQRVKEGLQIKAVASSIKTEEQALALGIPLLPLGEVSELDISIDGADEFTTGLQLIKGGGGALFREKIMASLSKNRVIITDSSKKVEKLGAFKVPVEIVPTACQYVLGQLHKIGGHAVLRRLNHELFISDNQNYIADVDFGLIDDPITLSICLNQIDGILAHGLFVNLTTQVIMSERGKLVAFGKS